MMKKMVVAKQDISYSPPFLPLSHPKEKKSYKKIESPPSTHKNLFSHCHERFFLV